MRTRFCWTPPYGGSQPIGQSGTSVGLQTNRSGGSKNCPVVRPNATLRRVMGLLLRENRRQKSKALPSAPQGISATCPASEAAEPRGARDSPMRRRLPRSSWRQRIVHLRIQSGSMRRNRHRPQCVCRQRGCSGSKRLRSSQASLNSNCQKTGESTFHFERRRTLRATLSSTLSNSTNGWLSWQRRS
jgi:hypothetical protein